MLSPYAIGPESPLDNVMRILGIRTADDTLVSVALENAFAELVAGKKVFQSFSSYFIRRIPS
jgi:hypothetical protein